MLTENPTINITLDTIRLNYLSTKSVMVMLWKKHSNIWEIYNHVPKYPLNSDTFLRDALDKCIGENSKFYDNGVYNKKDKLRLDFLELHLFNKIYWDNLRSLWSLGCQESTVVTSADPSIRKCIDRLIGIKE